MSKHRLGGKSSEKGDRRTGNLLDSSRESAPKRSGRRKGSDESLDRRSPYKNSFHSSSSKSIKERSLRRGDSRKLLDAISNHSGSKRNKKSDGRSSPDFGKRDSESEQRLDTFGPGRGQKSKSNYNLSKIDKKEDRKISTDYDWKRNKSRDNRPRDDRKNDTNSLRPPLKSNSRSKSREKERSRNRDLYNKSRDDKSDISHNRKGGQKGPISKSSYEDPKFQKHLTAKNVKRQAKPLNYNEARDKRQKDWLIDYTSHRPLIHISDKFEQSSKKTTSYLIWLLGVKKIPVDSIPQLKEERKVATLNYCCTLYDSHNKEFFGRSYTSRPIELVKGNFATEKASKDFIFMHTAEKTDLDLCIEAYLEIVDLEKKAKIEYISLGFCLFPLFSSKGRAKETDLLMYKGTPRLLLCKAPFKDMAQAVSQVTTHIKEYSNFDPLKIVVPSTTL